MVKNSLKIIAITVSLVALMILPIKLREVAQKYNRNTILNETKVFEKEPAAIFENKKSKDKKEEPKPKSIHSQSFTTKVNAYEFTEINKSLFTSNEKQGYLAQINKNGYSLILPNKNNVLLRHSLTIDNEWQISNRKAVMANERYETEYVNTAEGLRQNFIIKTPITNNNIISISQTVQSTATLNVNAHSVSFEKDNTTILTYNDLKVWDKNNQSLPAYFKSVNDSVFEIVVNTNNACYPITIDPLNTVPSAIIKNADQNNAFLGSSVSSAGDVNGDGYSDVLVGAPGYQVAGNANVGAAFLYYGSASGVNTTVVTTITPTTQAGAGVGNAVTNFGDWNADGYGDIAIAASKYDVGANVDEGIVFIYNGSATGIGSSPSLSLGGANQSGAEFGTDLALVGDYDGNGHSDLLVGAAKYDAGANVDEGAVFLFLSNASGIANGTAITTVGQAGAGFGTTVAGAGDVNGDGYSDIIVGAPLWNNSGSTDEGIVYVYHGNASGSTVAPTITLNNNTISNDVYFGAAISSAGDVNGDGYSDVVIGAYGHDAGPTTNAGRAHIFYGSATGLNNSSSLNFATPNQTNAEFGKAVSCAGDINGDGYADVIISADGFDTPTVNEGRTYLYYGSSIGLNTTATTLDDANQTNAFQGNSISSAGDINGDGYSDILVGCALYNDGFTAEGCVFVYNGEPGSIDENNPVVLENTDQNSAFSGYTVSRAGDVNGDGFDDILIGLPLYNEPSIFDVGIVFLYYGSANGLPALPSASFQESLVNNSRFGYSVATAGDINGDGYSDIIAGCPNCDNENVDEGAAFIYYGSSLGITTTGIRIDPTNQNGAGFGISVNTAGDVNGDGYSDIIVGASSYDTPTRADEGAAYVYYGSPSGISATPNIMYTSSAKAGAFFGISVSTVGDVNADGYSDVAVGAYFFSLTTSSIEGRAYLYYGAQIGLPATPNLTLIGENQSGAAFGKFISACGDVNGDGIDDFVVSANAYDNGAFIDAGRAYLYYGSVSGITEANRTNIISDNEFNANFGYFTGGLGDINGDGFPEVGIGAYLKDVPFSDVGWAYIFKGQPSFSGTNRLHQFTKGTHSNSWFGFYLNSAGDINGDGYGDILIGSPASNKPPFTRNGKTFVYYGNTGNNNKRHGLRIYLDNLTTPYNSIVGTNQTTFGIGIFARSFEGRSKAGIVWETKLNYLPYAGNPLTNSTYYSGINTSYVDLGINGTEVKSAVSKILSLHNFTKVRARIKYSPILTLTGQVYGPWRYNHETLAGIWMGALPLTINPITARWLQIGKTASINLTTHNEQHIEKVVLEKSFNGLLYTAIDSSVAQNKPINYYRFYDNNATDAKQHYRVVVIAPNGAKQYSNVQVLTAKDNQGVVIAPSVVSHTLTVYKTVVNREWAIINTNGAIVKTGKTNSGFTTINIESLPAGSYLFSIQGQYYQFAKQ